jgi:hypothetical protein
MARRPAEHRGGPGLVWVAAARPFTMIEPIGAACQSAGCQLALCRCRRSPGRTSSVIIRQRCAAR